jgi:hypothetical protein
MSIVPASHKDRSSTVRLRALACLTFACLLSAAAAADVTTHHGDAQRTGWNANETILSPATVNGSSFGLLASVTLDAQVDAQPLYVSNRTIAGGTHNVVYVATENDTVYAIDADSGAVLVQRNLGTPVPLSELPGQCNNNAATVGIGSTPVIDTTAGLLYAITYTLEGGNPVYRLHALDLGTLQDKVSSAVVAATSALTSGQHYSFNPAVSRQRSALLLANGNVYAAFSSFCDNASDTSRGWVLGWQAGSLTRLATSHVTDREIASPNDFFLNSIWMSGSGIAADETGNLLYVTANTDPGGTSYNRVLDLANSVVKQTPDLTRILSFFTPTPEDVLDRGDNDFGSGGVLVIPAQPGRFPHLAVAAGKDGMMYFLNRDALGGIARGNNDNDFGEYDIGGCWCSESYYKGADGVGRIVSSGNQNAIVWKIQTSKRLRPTLIQESISPTMMPSNQDPGYISTVSSNGTAVGTQIIWVLTKEAAGYPTNIYLYAFDPSNVSAGQSTQLFVGGVGQWANNNGNANLVPVVANGKVYVASYQLLTISGLTSGSPGHKPAIARLIPEAVAHPEAVSGHAVYGVVRRIDGARLTIENRTGRQILVDAGDAVQSHLSTVLYVGRMVMVRGEFDRAGTLHAEAILRAKDSPDFWEPDR